MTHTLNGIKYTLFLLLFLVSWVHSAYGYYCSEPHAPSTPSPFIYKPDKPRLPYCVNEYTRTHTCDDYTINSYNNALESYRNDLEYYIDQLQYYVEQAQDFANEALSYAKCEINSLD